MFLSAAEIAHELAMSDATVIRTAQTLGYAGLPELKAELQGALRSPTFTISTKKIHYRVAGQGTKLNLIIDNFQQIRDPIYGGLKRVVNHDDLRWITIDAAMWKGHRAYIELSDLSPPEKAELDRLRLPGS